MSTLRLQFEREYEFPSVIVWDALVDPDLVVGWLAQSRIVPTLGGEYDLVWLHRPSHPTTFGRIVRIDPGALLRVETDDLGAFEFELRPVRGGSRGRNTNLLVTVEFDAKYPQAARIGADWKTNLDQLEDLLRGRPVDWGNWARDRESSWLQHLYEEQNSTA